MCSARDWFGTMPEPGPVIYLNAEDDERELHFRLDAIRAHLGTTFAALKDLHLVPLAGEDALLGVPDRAGIIRPTPLFERLQQTAAKIKPVLIALDTAADMFGGNENDRSQVRQFIGLLRGLAITANAGVLLASHPSLTGINTDSGLSGSTGWHNSRALAAVFQGRQGRRGRQGQPRPARARGPQEQLRPERRGHPHALAATACSCRSARRRAWRRWPPSAQAEDLFLDLLDRFDRARPDAQPASDVADNYAPRRVRRAPPRPTAPRKSPSPTPCSGCSMPEPSASRPTAGRPAPIQDWCEHDASNPRPTPVQPAWRATPSYPRVRWHARHPPRGYGRAALARWRDSAMTKFNLDNAAPVVKDERLYNLARAIGLREWHTSPAIQVDFETYFARQQERLLARPRRSL